MLPSVCSSSWHMSWTALHLSLLSLLTSVSSSCCQSTWIDSFSSILNSSCHRLDTFLGHVDSHSICNCSLFLFCLWYCSLLICFMTLNSLLPFVATSNTFWTLHALTLLAQDITYSQVISFVFSVAVSSLIISPIIISSFMLFINSFNFLFLYNCFYLPLFWAGLANLQHFHSVVTLICSIAMTIWLVMLWLLLLLNTVNSPVFFSIFLAPYHLESVWVTPSLGQFSIIGTITFLCNTVTGPEMFFTPVSNLHSSWFLSEAFQSNIGGRSPGPLDLGIVCNGLALLTC